MRAFVRGCGLLALAVLLGLSLASLFAPSRTPAFGGSPFSSHHMTVVVFSSSSSVIGGPTLSASFVDRVLTAYGSPAVGLGRALVDDSQRFHIDDVYAYHLSARHLTLDVDGACKLANVECPNGLESFQNLANVKVLRYA